MILVVSRNVISESYQEHDKLINFFATKTDLEFTVVVPSVDISTINKDRLKEFIFEHLIPGEAFTTFNEEDLYGNSNNHMIKFTHLSKHNESIWALNDLKILRTAVLNKQCSVIYIDGVLGDKRTLFSKRNIHDNNRYVRNFQLNFYYLHKNAVSIDFHIMTKAQQVP